ncbi:hypothetical protein PP175_14280 [Aneurinibacillus sp. Ricciae_BoGa-3]|uniref:hypothetical protein n=1 Tax=Aneurinibacillus sp. Ricciae_BoGa-3 TaxID=3022697 RepID=UPI00234195EE|nr:hypothetical protein [Aneurinibacillus sp. Ricciae_BoGa-3]WCK52601.1 hypothetical protein PP175_14280 [Aneurinibacillus sp. Ricciae_BoGa-3]
MQTKKLMGLLIFLVLVVSGCSAPYQELSVYKGSCHIVGNDVYFSYNGIKYTAKNQKTNYQTLLNKNSGTEDIPVIAMDDGSYMIPDN